MLSKMKIFFLYVILIVVSVASSDFSQAKYFSNISGDRFGDVPESVWQASSDTFSAISSLFGALSEAEISRGGDISDSLTEVRSDFTRVADDFKALSEADFIQGIEIELGSLSGNDKEFFVNKAISLGIIDNQGDFNDTSDVFLITSAAIQEFIESIRKFEEDGSIDRYSDLRKSLGELLRVGEIGTRLLSS